MTAPSATQDAVPPPLATRPAPRLTLPALEGLQSTEPAPPARAPVIPPAVPTAQPRSASSADAVPVNPAAAAQAAAETEARRTEQAPTSRRQSAPVTRAETRAPVASAQPAEISEVQPEVDGAALEVAETAPVATPVNAAPVEPAPAAEASAGDMSLLLWGGAGLLVLGGIGLAFALRRGRKTASEEPVLAPSARAPEARRPDMVSREPLAPRAPIAMPIVSTPVPGGLGRHEAAALRGPTPDNPFATRRARMRRAHFYDYHERLAAEATPGSVSRAPTPRHEPRPAAVEAVGPSVSDRVRGKVRSIADAASWQVGGPMKPSYSG